MYLNNIFNKSFLGIVYDYENNYEIISFPENPGVGIEGPIFMQLCDALSVNFNDFSKMLIEYFIPLKKFPKKKMTETLKTMSYLLDTDNFMQNISIIYDKTQYSKKPTLEEIICYFSEFMFVQAYVEVMQEKKVFENKDVFRSFISGFPLNPNLIEFENLYDGNNIFLGMEASTCQQDNIDKVLNFADSLGKYDFHMSNFYLNDSLKAICTSIYYLLDRGYTIKKCSNCGKYFVPYNRSDTIYCDRMSPQDSNRTCKEYTAAKLWYDKLKQSEVASLCRKISQAKQKKASRYKDLPIYAEQYERFQKESKQWKADIKKGIKTEAEFLEWLTSERSK